MTLKKIAVLGLVGLSALVISACTKNTTSASQNNSGASNTQQQGTSNAASAATVTLTDSGITPAQVTIKSGESITWVNNGTKKIQLASDPHPTHTANPEVSGGQFVVEVAPGASTTTTLTKAGTWGFHDHLNPAVRGKVTVE